MGFLIFLFWAAITLGVAIAAAWGFRAVAAAVTRGEMRRALRNAPLTASFGMLVIFIYLVVAILAPLIAPFPERTVVGSQFIPWSAEHWLGTDALGRDMFSRMIYGTRNTVGIAFATTALAFLIGSVFGLLAATVGGWLDQGLSRLVDVMMAIPSLIFALLLLTIFGTSILTLILVIAVIDSTRVFRLARAVTEGVVVMDYIEAARLRGEGLGYLITREILPNVTAPLVAEFGLRFCFVFLSISALSFLGLGIQPPTADWGSMVRENATLITFGDITPLLPAGAIALLTVAVNFVVDWQLYRASGLKE
ncbi:ABC transporter permease [Rhodobacteraceae bacterium 2376]|uniref:ABC transporter permease n=1 Tax=Rhabdonatronobacter sediminivivens TaxID=2743469 RepID=A0A7Z0I1M9_9RHOB|nr:ABC transporter permease [Rhabdonatronobacter sediminivivens]NYS26291.1 ABC transporter permease [Rhabdonatronobacter sediminivivens]